MSLCDTGPFIALIDSDDAHHTRCVRALPALHSPLVSTWACLTEAMCFLGSAGGWRLQAPLWQMLRSGVLRLHVPSEEEMLRTGVLMERYRDIPMDLADASLVAAAETLGLSEILTLDRHFYAYRIHDTQAFTVVPCTGPASSSG